ncbi:MAG: SAM hydrolase/SAM-dependent halogenase family protein [Acidimicrobiales bacterium]
MIAESGSRPVVCLTDYGRADEFAGLLHRVIDATAPGTRVIDLTHEIPAHDVRAGALTLWRAMPWLVPAVILAVVDPGVGSQRRAVALEVAEAATVLVGPDNGLLLPSAAAAGPITAAVDLGDPAWHLPAIPGRRAGATFAGRDIFAPVAAHAARGVPVAKLGSPIDPASLAGDPVPGPRPGEGTLEAEIVSVDHFGNIQLNARPADADHLGSDIDVEVAGKRIPAMRAAAFAELGPSLGLVTDGTGLLSLALDRASAAARLGVGIGGRIVLRRR